MARGKIITLIIGLALCGVTSIKAQSKKEIIQMLTQKTDSLEKALSAKNQNLHQLEVKLARVEGAAEVNNSLIQRLENKADSLKELLITKNATIESQSAQIAKLNADLSGLQAQEKDWNTKNEALLAELKTFKEKPGSTPIAATPKETKAATPEPPKEKEPAKAATATPPPTTPTANTATQNKTEP